MEDGLVHQRVGNVTTSVYAVLILIVVEDGLVLMLTQIMSVQCIVLILIVVEDGLVHKCNLVRKVEMVCLNPYCSGRWSRTSR